MSFAAIRIAHGVIFDVRKPNVSVIIPVNKTLAIDCVIGKPHFGMYSVKISVVATAEVSTRFIFAKFKFVT